MEYRKEQRLNHQIAEAQERWQRLHEKRRRLNKEYDLETRTDEKLRLEDRIAENRGQLDQLEAELNSMENQLADEEQVTPNFPNDEVQSLSESLQAAYETYETTLSEGGDTTVIQTEIVNLKRQIREGGQLKPGDFLLDGRFKLIETIGRGGFATVWKSLDRKRRQLVLMAS